VALYLIEHASVDADVVIIKFGRTVKISTLINPNFTVESTDATPIVVNSPFAPINTITDYNQISRTLRLFWDQQLTANKEYKIKVTNLFDAVNEKIPSESIVFTKNDDATPSTVIANITSFLEPDYEEILIEDKSLRIDAFSTVQIIAKNPNFFIKSIDPENGSFYIDNSHNNGRVTITFNARPASNFLNSDYFKVQRKKIQRIPSRWETVSANVSIHSWEPEVYLDMPSTDATPVFYPSDKEYYETGYKYRIIISKDIGI
jgi:hypothetical protein